jgi:hypothetical protein
VTSNSQSIYENSTYKKYNDLLNKYLPEWLGGTPSDRKKEQDEKSYGYNKNLLSKIADAIVTPAGAASMQPSIGGYQPNVPLNAQAARLGAKGRHFFRQWLASSGRWKVNMDFLPDCCLR